jgi:hypothetical protein
MMSAMSRLTLFFKQIIVLSSAHVGTMPFCPVLNVDDSCLFSTNLT